RLYDTRCGSPRKPRRKVSSEGCSWVNTSWSRPEPRATGRFPPAMDQYWATGWDVRRDPGPWPMSVWRTAPRTETYRYLDRARNKIRLGAPNRPVCGAGRPTLHPP